MGYSPKWRLRAAISDRMEYFSLGFSPLNLKYNRLKFDIQLDVCFHASFFTNPPRRTHSCHPLVMTNLR